MHGPVALPKGFVMNDETQPVAPAQVVSAAMAAYERGDLDALAELVHPEAEIQMLLLGGDVARGPEGLREALAQVTVVHQPTVTAIESIGDDAALMIGRLQYTDTRGGLSDHPAVWLSVLRDGKLWRSLTFGSVEEARAGYDALGTTDASA